MHHKLQVLHLQGQQTLREFKSRPFRHPTKHSIVSYHRCFQMPWVVGAACLKRVRELRFLFRFARRRVGSSGSNSVAAVTKLCNWSIALVGGGLLLFSACLSVFFFDSVPQPSNWRRSVTFPSPLFRQCTQCVHLFSFPQQKRTLHV